MIEVMLERFTDRARRVVVLAQEEARMLNHDYIGTEHLLLGLMREGDGVAAQALESLGISPDEARAAVEEIVGRGQQAPSGHIPFTPRVKKVLELSSREAQQLGHNYIGTEHILLGLTREGEGVGAQVVVKLGAELNRVRREVIDLVSGSAQDRESLPGDGITGPELHPRQGDLREFVEDLLREQKLASGSQARELGEIRDVLRDVVARLERIEGRLSDDDAA